MVTSPRGRHIFSEALRYSTSPNSGETDIRVPQDGRELHGSNVAAPRPAPTDGADHRPALLPTQTPVASDDEQTLHVVVQLPGRPAGVAAERFEGYVRRFAVDLAKETSRLELDARADGEEEPVVTPSMVTKANFAVRNPRSEASGPLWMLISTQIAVTPTGIVAGVFGSYLHSWWQWTGLLASGGMALVCQIYVVLAVIRRTRT
jgi:hypothetical protein